MLTILELKFLKFFTKLKKEAFDCTSRTFPFQKKSSVLGVSTLTDDNDVTSVKWGNSSLAQPCVNTQTGIWNPAYHTHGESE